MTRPLQDAADLKPLMMLLADAVAADRPGSAPRGTVQSDLVGQLDRILHILLLGPGEPNLQEGAQQTMSAAPINSSSLDESEWREILRLGYLFHLGREPAESEYKSWPSKRKVENGSSVLLDTLRSIAASDEAGNLRKHREGALLDFAPTIFMALYAHCLGRPADPQEIADRVNDLKNGGQFVASAVSIAASEEARAFAASNPGSRRSMRWMPPAGKRYAPKGQVAAFLKNRPIAELAMIPAETQPAAGARRIAIDALQIEPGVSGGVEVYMKTLIRAIQSMPDHDIVLICQYDQVENYMSMFGSSIGYCFPDPRSEDEDLRWITSLRENDPKYPADIDGKATFRTLKAVTAADVLHSPVQIFSHYDSQLPSVLNLHDLQHLHLPENFSASDLAARNEHYGRSARLADSIIASSRFVSDDIVDQMHIPRGKLRLIPATWNPDLNVDMDAAAALVVAKKYKLPPHFIFFPGQFWKHKNQVRLVEALAAVRTRLQHLDLHLVLTGYRGHSGWPDVELSINQAGLNDKVICLDYIPIEDLPGLYKSAMACVVPSLFEASSYPVIEAQRIGCPSACSAITSLPELMAEGAGLLFDPRDTNDMASAIERLCSDEQLRSRIVTAARRKVERDHSMAAYVDGIRKTYDALAPAEQVSK